MRRTVRGLALLAIVLMGPNLVETVRLGPSIRENERALRAYGYPLTADELMAKLAVPPERNAAPEMLRVAEIGTRTNAEVVRALPEVRRLLAHGRAKGDLLIKRDWTSEPWAVTLPEVSSWRKIGDELTFESRRALAEGRYDRYEANVAALQDLGSLVAREPYMIAALTARRYDRLSEDLMREGLHASSSPRMFARLDRLAARRAPYPSLARGLIIESYGTAWLTQSRGHLLPYAKDRSTVTVPPIRRSMVGDVAAFALGSPFGDFLRIQTRDLALGRLRETIEIFETISDPDARRVALARRHTARLDGFVTPAEEFAGTIMPDDLGRYEGVPRRVETDRLIALAKRKSRGTTQVNRLVAWREGSP